MRLGKPQSRLIFRLRKFWLGAVFCAASLIAQNASAAVYLPRIDGPACDEDIFIPDGHGGGKKYPALPWANGWAASRVFAGDIARLRGQLPRRWSGRVSERATSCLAAITCYWKNGTGVDEWTARGQSSTGVKLARGVVAVDPLLIPYGSLVKIDGVEGSFLAADCGSDVIRREAVRRSARTVTERKAVVVDVFFPTEKEGRAFDARLPRFVQVRFFPPVL